MHLKMFFGVLAVLVLLVSAMGCTQSTTTTPATTVATTAPVAEETTEAPITEQTTTTTATLETPGPTQTLQSTWAVDIQIQSNGKSIDPEITATFRGGKGMNVIPLIEVIVTHADGTVVSDSMSQPLYIGKSVTLKSTTGNDNRAEVYVTSPQGDRVKVYDAYVPFRSYN
ncbi:MAG: hypothetical protein WC342_04085 [Methanoregula sp.]|jgi:hypothetical protein